MSESTDDPRRELPTRVYESMVASHFLMEVGYRNCELKQHDANVLQLHQTPLDWLVGDAVHVQEGRHFIIEFKRDQESIDREKTKLHRRWLIEDLDALRSTELKLVRRLRTSIAEGHSIPPSLLNQCRIGHFLCWREGNERFARVQSYARFVDPKTPHWEGPREFCNRVEKPESDSLPQLGLDRDDFLTYSIYLAALAAVAASHKDDKGDAGDSPMVLGTVLDDRVSGVALKGLNVLVEALSLNTASLGKLNESASQIARRRMPPPSAEAIRPAARQKPQ